MGAITSVRNLLQGHSSIVVNESDFDAHPHLLNTPAGVVDLRTGAMSDHNPLLLLRQITLIAPDYIAVGDYESHCPLFFRVLRNMAAGREWVIPALRHWFAYCLTGDLRHQSPMFLHGPPQVAHFGDPRFRGVHLLYAQTAAIDLARRLRDQLVLRAATTGDHALTDEFVRRLESDRVVIGVELAACFRSPCPGRGWKFDRENAPPRASSAASWSRPSETPCSRK
jgi:hypothetical protein